MPAFDDWGRGICDWKFLSPSSPRHPTHPPPPPPVSLQVNCNGFTIEDEELSHLGSAIFPE